MFGLCGRFAAGQVFLPVCCAIEALQQSQWLHRLAVVALSAHYLESPPCSSGPALKHQVHAVDEGHA